LKTKFMVHN